MAGFNLIELLVAMVIGLILILAVGNTFLGMRVSHRFADADARLQENGRFAIRSLSRDIREAGFYGCGVRSTTFQLHSVLKSANTPPWNFSQAVSGYEGGTAGWTPTLTAAVYNPGGRSGVDATAPKAGSDVISVRRPLGTSLRILAHPSSQPPGKADLRVPAGNSLKQGEVVLASDCSSGTVFQITNDPATAGGVVEHKVEGSPGNSTMALGREYAQGELTRVATVTYFLRSTGSGSSALYRVVGQGEAQQLMEGVEGMQFRFGEDTDGDATIDRYVDAGGVGDWGRVLSVQVALLLQSLDDGITDGPQKYVWDGQEITPADHRLRRVFSTTVNLRNRVP